MGRPSVEWSTKLWEGLRVQFNKQKFSDLAVNVLGEIVHVHRVVLSTQSDALSELLPSTYDDAVMNWSAHCNDINHAKDFLKSLYYGYANVHQDNVLALLKLAKIYDVVWLVNEAESFARNHINHSNILEYLDFAVIYECTELKEACSAKLFKYNKKYSLERIAQPLVKVWLHITPKTLSYVASHDKLCVEDEVEVFHYVMCWIEAGQREITSPLTCVRYGFLPANFYALFALPYVMKADPSLGAYLAESEISCPVFSADEIRRPSPGAINRFKTPRSYRYYRSEPSFYKETVVQVSEEFLSKEKFSKVFPLSSFTVRIEVDEKVSISVEVPKSRASSTSTRSEGGSSRGRSKANPGAVILSNLDEEDKGEVSLNGTSSQDGDNKSCDTYDIVSPTSQEVDIHSDPGKKPPIPKTDSGGSSSAASTQDARDSSRDTLFYCYCLSPATRQPLALFRWWNSGSWSRNSFDMLIKQAHGTLALGIIVVR